MESAHVHQLSCKALVVFSLTALVTVLIGFTQPPQPDEGTLAHLFQLSVVAVGPLILLFLATADWSEPRRRLRFLALPVTALALAFGALYYLEHLR